MQKLLLKTSLLSADSTPSGWDRQREPTMGLYFLQTPRFPMLPEVIPSRNALGHESPALRAAKAGLAGLTKSEQIRSALQMLVNILNIIKTVYIHSMPYFKG